MAKEQRPQARIVREEQCPFCWPEYSPCRYADRSIIGGRPWPQETIDVIDHTTDDDPETMSPTP